MRLIPSPTHRESDLYKSLGFNHFREGLVQHRIRFFPGPELRVVGYLMRQLRRSRCQVA